VTGVDSPRDARNCAATVWPVVAISTGSAMRADASSPTPNRSRAYGPAIGVSARAACSAVLTCSWRAPSVAPVATRMNHKITVVMNMATVVSAWR
jgi:hypothetical protein